jgi:hypothetical protein
VTLALIQGSEEWKLARCGSLGASQIHEALATTKSGWGASRANVMAQLIAERLTGSPTEGYINDAMRWGTDHEADARAAYQFMTDNAVIEVGLVQHPRIGGTHASPDGLVGEDGLVEFKCPQTSTHIDTLLGTPVAQKYVLQCQWQMACAERAWCDWVSFDPRMPPAMQLFIKRIGRDDREIARLEREVSVFLAETADRVARLRSLYEGDPSADLKEALQGSLSAGMRDVTGRLMSNLEAG